MHGQLKCQASSTGGSNAHRGLKKIRLDAESTDQRNKRGGWLIRNALVRFLFTNILFACLDSTSSFETLFELSCAVFLCVHSAPVSSHISLYVNTRLKLRGSKGQRPPHCFPFYRFLFD